jgi:CBS domain containing-hemolysin-like protein
MGSNLGIRLFVSLLLVLASGFFVAAEYALVGSRKSRLESLGRRGSKNARAIAKAIEDISPLIAGTQIGITLLSIAIGSFTEPFVSELLHPLLKSLNPTLAEAISLLLITFVLVVVGELGPKYVSLRHPERVALVTYRPLRTIGFVLSPLIWLAQNTTGLLLRPFGIRIEDHASTSLPKEELLMLVQSGGAEGTLDKTHAEMVTRALRLDVLAARDIMVHRLDVKWVDISLDRAGLLQKIRTIPFTRLPVCRGEIDDMVGLVYLHDIVKHLDDAVFSLEAIVRPLVAIPENLPMERIVQTMREEKTQMLVVMDEYGGTSGVVTLEDVVEEVFGELEDRLESERPVIEQFPAGRVSARADVRVDELVSRLHLNQDFVDDTDTLAQVLIDALERVPRPGDSVETTLGTMRVENMARRRITRVSIQLLPALINPIPEEEE